MLEENINTELNDRTIRIVLIPFFGFIIPNLTGMIDNARYTLPQLAGAYLYFTFVAFSIWQGNRYLLFRLRLRFSWLSQPMYKVIALIVSNIFYTIPISVGLMSMWYVYAAGGAADWDVIYKATALCVVCVVFITHTYETVFLIKSWGTDKTKSEELEKAKVQAELEALKSQIDPHFMFNSLNTLSHLIENDSVKAKQFNDNLAEVYRYILFNKERNLVLLSEELQFAEKYFSLINIRFGNAVGMTVNRSDDPERLLIPPISLQLLIENAIKHNEFSERKPMTITVDIVEGKAVITNGLRAKKGTTPSSHIGLHNLNDRYRLITERTITVRNDGRTFTVELPLLRVS